MNVVEFCLLHGLKAVGPDHPAILSSEESLSYGALTDRVSQFAAGLTAAGLRPGDRVAMVMHDTPDLVAMHLASMAAGGIAVAISTRAGADELVQTLAIVQPRMVVVDSDFDVAVATAMAVAASKAQLLRRERELRDWRTRDAGVLLPVARAPEEPAFWVMTSGTTGQPKAVEHHHGTVSVCAAFPGEVMKVTPADRSFTTSRLHFAYALSTLFGMLRVGATNVLLERWATTPAVGATLERFEPSIVLSVPSVYHRLIEDGLPRLPAFAKVRCYVSAGERLPPRIWNAWREASGRPILDCLGCSESMYMIIANQPGACRPGASGLPVPGVEVRIVDEYGKVVVEPAQTGRLEIRTPSVCSGYRDRETGPTGLLLRPAERFRREGWFATGDEYMRDDEGFYHHRGRTGDMLRVSGMWISPAEIEDALIGVPSIADAAAVLGESPLGLAEIVLYLVPAAGGAPINGANGHAVTAAARERLAQVLPPYKLPRRFEAVDDLPRTATGKVQRHKLRDRLRREAP